MTNAQRVKNGIKVFNKLFGRKWPKRFLKEPITGITYTGMCNRCIADIAQGSELRSGYREVYFYARDKAVDCMDLGVVAKGIDAPLVREWKKQIKKLLGVKRLPVAQIQ